MKTGDWLKKAWERLRTFGLKEWGTVLLVGICLLVIALPQGKSEEKAKDKAESSGQQAQTGQGGQTEPEGSLPAAEKDTGTADYAGMLEKRLEELLCLVDGVGSVRVMVTVKSTAERMVLKDGKAEDEESLEQDSLGGSRAKNSSSREETTVLVENGTASVPYVMKECYPEVEGVVVLAEGSGTGSVDFDILTAVQVLFGVPAHKIKIMKMQK